MRWAALLLLGFLAPALPAAAQGIETLPLAPPEPAAPEDEAESRRPGPAAARACASSTR